MSSISQSQRSTLLSASLLHTDWLNPVRSLARGGGEEESGEGGGRGVLFTEGASGRARERQRRAGVSRRGLRVHALFVRPPAFTRSRRRRGARGGREDGRRTPAWMCHTVTFSTRSQNHAGAAAVACRAASPVRGGSGLNRCLEIPNKNQER